MPLIIPTLRQIAGQARAEVGRLLPGLDPTIDGSMIRAIVESVAIRINAANALIEQAAREAFPQTATGANLERFAEGISRNAAAGSSGTVVLFGTGLSIVPLETALTSSSGQVYRTQATATLGSQTIGISSLSSVAGVATAIAAGHSLASGQDATIEGANDALYNGTFKVTVLDANTFTYPIEGSPNSPTSGTITATFTGALATVVSEGVGIGTNVESGARLTITSPISGVESGALVRFDAITGGANIEGDEALRGRILEARAAIEANFSADTIVLTAKNVPGVTRVSVRPATPEPGDVTIHFLRDGDVNIIPSGVDVQAVRDQLLAIIPGSMETSSLIVSAPTAVVQNFAFSAISPNTAAMRDAVRATLQAFFEENADIGQSISADVYRAALIQTVTGSEQLQSFTLTEPSADIVMTADQIAILGDITFA